MSKRAKVPTVGRRRTITDEPILPPDDEGDDPFRMALEEFGENEGLTLQVYRHDPLMGKPRYAKSIPYEKSFHGLEWLQRTFGAGDYLLRFYNAEGKSRNRTVSVDDPPGARRRDAEPEKDSARDELVKLLRDQNNIFLAALMKGGGAAGSTPPTESPVVMKILEVLLPQAVAKPADTSGLMLSMLEKGIGIAMDAKSEGEGGMAGLIRSVAKELGPVIQEFARARMMSPPPGMVVRPVPPVPPMLVAPPAPPPASSPPPSPAPGPNGPPPPSPEETARAMVEGTVRFGIDLVERAWQGREKPEDVADWILGEIPPNYYDHLKGLTYERLNELNPRYGAIDRQWLELVLSHLREEAEGEEDAGASESP